MISATEPDFSREVPARWYDPPRRLIRAMRKYQYWQRRGGVLSILMKRFWVLQHRFWTVCTASDIPINCQIEGGLILTHPSGVVVHSDARIGPNCLLGPHVTIGTGGKIPGAPILEGHVDIGAGACILGGVRLGYHSVVGANAVVLTDVPAGALAVGVPARIIQRS